MYAYDEEKGVFTIHDKGVFEGWTIPGDVGNSMDLNAMTEPGSRSLLTAPLDPPGQDSDMQVEPEVESSGDEPDPPSGSPGT